MFQLKGSTNSVGTRGLGGVCRSDYNPEFPPFYSFTHSLIAHLILFLPRYPIIFSTPHTAVSSSSHSICSTLIPRMSTSPQLWQRTTPSKPQTQNSTNTSLKRINPHSQPFSVLVISLMWVASIVGFAKKTSLFRLSPKLNSSRPPRRVPPPTYNLPSFTTFSSVVWILMCSLRTVEPGRPQSNVFAFRREMGGCLR